MIRARVADTCSGATPCAWRCFGVRRGEAKEAVGKRFIHPIVEKSKWTMARKKCTSWNNEELEQLKWWDTRKR